jgi:hypothetical protein
MTARRLEKEIIAFEAKLCNPFLKIATNSAQRLEESLGIEFRRSCMRCTRN